MRRLPGLLLDLKIEPLLLGEMSRSGEEEAVVSYATSLRRKRRFRQPGEQDGLGVERTFSSKARNLFKIIRIPRLMVKSMVLRMHRTMAPRSIDSLRLSVQDLKSRPYTTTPLGPDSIQ
jgi:hypothetical protein